MTTFLVIFVMMLSMIALMAVGVMFKRAPISGSCGGLANVGLEKSCDCDEPCERRRQAEQGKHVTTEAPISLSALHSSEKL